MEYIKETLSDPVFLGKVKDAAEICVETGVIGFSIFVLGELSRTCLGDRGPGISLGFALGFAYKDYVCKPHNDGEHHPDVAVAGVANDES